jgi:cystathionine beta-lyase/cystathionine gamma-synthase
MTHASMSREVQLKMGITPDLVRVSVGLEDASDLIADFRSALAGA